MKKEEKESTGRKEERRVRLVLNLWKSPCLSPPGFGIRSLRIHSWITQKPTDMLKIYFYYQINITNTNRYIPIDTSSCVHS